MKRNHNILLEKLDKLGIRKEFFMMNSFRLDLLSLYSNLLLRAVHITYEQNLKTGIYDICEKTVKQLSRAHDDFNKAFEKLEKDIMNL